MGSRIARINRTYWWVITSHNGHMVVLGCKDTEDEAWQYGYINCPNEFEVKPLQTKDTAKAVRVFKGEILNDTHDLDKALERFKHKI